MPLRSALFIALIATLLTGCIIIPFPSGGTSDLREITVMDSDRALTTSRFLIVDIDGPISMEKTSELFGEGTSMVEDVHDALERARDDHHIRALIVRINSPGGDPTASDIICSELRRYSEETGVPVVAHLLGTAASGGYYIATGAERIVAHPTTVTGSIGVLLMTLNVEGLEDLVGVRVGALTSGTHKDILSPFRPMTDEERGIIQSVINDLYGQFIHQVALNRTSLTEQRIRELADGRIYTANQALEVGLIDEISDLPGLIDELKEELNLRDVEVIAYRRSGGSGNIYSRAPMAAPRIELSLFNTDAITGGLDPGFYYLWIPGL